MSNRPRLGYLPLLVLLLGVLAACVARLEEMGGTGSQGELHLLTPQPETAQPTELPPTVVTEVVTTEPTLDPYFAMLTAYPTFPATPTPEPEGFEPEVGPTATTRPTMSAVVDLAEGVPPQETMEYIVRRADGRLERYLIPIAMLPTDSTYPQVRDQLLNLGPEDVLIDAAPLQMRPMLPAPETPPPADNP